MKLLFITDNKIKGFGGGSLGGKKYYDALKKYCDKYGHELKIISLDNDFTERLPIEIYKNRKIDILSRISGHSTYLYLVLKNRMTDILSYKSDIIFLGRSRLGFIAKYIKQKSPNTKIVTFIDNIEYDYVESYFSKKTSIVGKLAKYLEKTVVKSDEAESISYSDKLVYLTQRDFIRAQQLYNYKDTSPTILPVCLPNEQELILHSSIKHVYFIGSLNYGANIEAIEDFVNNVWIPYYKNNKRIKLVIAGSSPTEAVENLLQKADNIGLVKNFGDVKDFINKHSFMIAPIASGAGMKVKVADTLSMGLMIAASDEALVGYEEALYRNQLGGIIRANNTEEYKKAIDLYMGLSDDILLDIEQQNMSLFYDYYSFKRSRAIIEDIINQLNL